MIKRYRDEDFWYEISSAPDAGGRMTRAYKITCRYCGRLKSFRTTGFADEKMRKHLIRDGWEIGRVAGAHVCPGCIHRHKDKSTSRADVSVTPPPSPMIALELAWMACSEKDRETFALKLYEEYFAAPPQPPSPLFAPLSPTNGETMPLDPPTIDGDDDTPADWWLELQTSGATK